MTRLERHLLFWLWLSLAWLTYVTPWALNPGAGLTVNAYDLAEWASLHPTAQANALLTPLLLRAPLMFLTWLIALHAPRELKGSWWWHVLAILVLVLAQLPPLEFLGETGDPNYRQQALLAVLSLGGAWPLLWLKRGQSLLTLLLAFLLGLSALIGGLQGAQLMREPFGMPAHLSLGWLSFVGVALLLMLSAAVRLRGQR